MITDFSDFSTFFHVDDCRASVDAVVFVHAPGGLGGGAGGGDAGAAEGLDVVAPGAVGVGGELGEEQGGVAGGGLLLAGEAVLPGHHDGEEDEDGLVPGRHGDVVAGVEAGGMGGEVGDGDGLAVQRVFGEEELGTGGGVADDAVVVVAGAVPEEGVGAGTQGEVVGRVLAGGVFDEEDGLEGGGEVVAADAGGGGDGGLELAGEELGVVADGVAEPVFWIWAAVQTRPVGSAMA
jgi:hypothetical protein